MCVPELKAISANATESFHQRRFSRTAARLIRGRIFRCLGDELEPRTKRARQIAPYIGGALEFEDVFLVRPPHEPSALGELAFELSTRPPRVADECADGVMLRHGKLLCLLQRNVVAALENIGLRVPAECREE